MLPEHYLDAGIDALTRSHSTPTEESGFGNGHRAAALLSAYFLLQDGLIEEQAKAPMQSLADHWTRYPGFEPMPPEPAAPGELDRLLTALAPAFGTDRAHGVIFPSLALRAFRQRPDLITRSRIDGLMRIAQAYTPQQPFEHPLPEQPFSAGAFADRVLAGFTESTKAYGGRFQGYSFHLLTFGQAVHDLQVLGYVELARRAESGFNVFLENCLLGPQGPNHEMAFAVKDPTAQLIRPEQAGFWLPMKKGPEFAHGLGHVIKYAYAFNTLSRHATDAQVLERARERYYLSAWG